jgi:hypothetical protein
LKLEWVLTIANAAGTNGLTCLPKHGDNSVYENMNVNNSITYIHTTHAIRRF